MLKDAQRATLTVLFDALDATCDGLITLDDATTRADQACVAFALDEASPAHRALHTAYRQAWDELVRFADADKNGAIDREEFLQTMDRGMLADADYLDRSMLVITRACFDAGDANGDGMIDVEEYARGFMMVDPSLADVAHAGFELLDTDGDGLVSRDELLAAMHAACSGGEVPAALGGSVVR